MTIKGKGANEEEGGVSTWYTGLAFTSIRSYCEYFGK